MAEPLKPLTDDQGKLRDQLFQAYCAGAMGFHEAVTVAIQRGIGFASAPPIDASRAEDARDAARYRTARYFIGATRFGLAPIFTIDIKPPKGVFQGSVTQHFDEAIDAARALATDVGDRG